MWEESDALAKAKENLEASLTRLLTFDEHVIVSIIDTKGIIIYANDKFCKISQYSQDELIGADRYLLNFGHHPKSFFDEIYKTLANGDVWQGEIKNRAKNGSYYWVDTTISPSKDQAGKVTQYFAVHTDITGRKIIETTLQKNLDILNTTFDNFPGGISLVDEGLILRKANPAFYKLLDLPESLFPIGASYESIIRYNAERGEYGEGDIETLVNERVELAKNFKEHSIKRIRPEGISLEIKGMPLPEGGFITTYMDITDIENMVVSLEGKSQEAIAVAEDLQKAKDIQTDAVNNMSEALILWDENDRLFTVNPMFKTMYSGMSDILKPGLPYEEFVRQAYIRKVYMPYKKTFELAVAERVERHKQTPSSFEEQLFDGRWVRVNQRAASNGRIVGTIADISGQKKSEMAIKHMAETDGLTGLPNREKFREELQIALDRVNRNGQHVGVLLLDLDHFKLINDTLGHPLGDALLVEVANRLQKCIRSGDVVARLGGDEFAIITTILQNDYEIDTLAQRIKTALAVPHKLEGQKVETGVSIGITVYPTDSSNTDELLRNADVALYKAKGAGRDRYRLFDHKMNAEVTSRRLIERDLRLALEKDQLELYYQPKIDITNGHIIGVEALLRWQHPDRGIISPVEFVPIAEACRLIVPIGEWVLNRACHQAQEWRNQGLPTISVAVNVSAIQFKHQNLVSMIKKALKEFRLDPGFLELEITESVAMETKSADQFKKLKQLGIKMSIDDFGTGFSSLSQLTTFPVNRLKIDRSFVTRIESNPDRRAVCSAIINMAKGLNLKVIAEGVETIKELEVLTELGCDEMQGYLCAPALPASIFAEFLQAHNPKSQFGEKQKQRLEHQIKQVKC